MSEAKPSQSASARISPAAKRKLLFAAAAVLAIAGLLATLSGLRDLQAVPAGGNLLDSRDQLVVQLANRAKELRDQFQSAASEPHLLADVEAGALADAATRLKGHWPALGHAQFFTPRLEAAISEGGDGGFGRMAVVGQALVEPGVALGVVGNAGALQVGMALTLRAEEAPLAVAYAELPISGFADLLQAIEVGGGLLQLRNGVELLSAKGDESLAGLAVPVAVPGTPFYVAVAAPDSMTGNDPVLAFAIAGTLLLAAVVAYALARRGASSSVPSHEPTLADAVAKAAAVPTPAPKASAPAADSVEPGKPASKVAVDRSIFRAYDIRGVVGSTLDAGVARLIGQAIGSLMREQGLREIVVGRDGRLSGPELSAALIEGLRSAGCDVIDIGQAATPVVYFASYQLHAGSCVAVTGSHNPPDYNGFKIVVGGETLSGDAIQDLYRRIAENSLHSAAKGGLQTIDVSRDYIERIASDVQLERRMRVVIDCGNGVPGAIAPDVLEAIGCEAEPLYCEVDGNFPNHHPDPSDPDNLKDLITAVQRTRAEVGLAFDGDGDRLGVVTPKGKIIYPDRVLMLFAQDVLSRNPGAAVIYDVKCTGHLTGQILRHGGSPIMWKTGHSLIKAKMKETGAELAGEMSGHFFFKERWYGFDDGIYSAARLLEILAADDRDADEIFAELPDSVSTPELKVMMQEGEHYLFIEEFRQKARFEGAKIVTIDGVRADWPDGWGLVRCSNTTPCLVLRFDADSEAALARIQAAFRSQLEAVRPGMKLPF